MTSHILRALALWYTVGVVFAVLRWRNAVMGAWIGLCAVLPNAPQTSLRKTLALPLLFAAAGICALGPLLPLLTLLLRDDLRRAAPVSDPLAIPLDEPEGSFPWAIAHLRRTPDETAVPIATRAAWLDLPGAYPSILWLDGRLFLAFGPGAGAIPWQPTSEDIFATDWLRSEMPYDDEPGDERADTSPTTSQPEPAS